MKKRKAKKQKKTVTPGYAWRRANIEQNIMDENYRQLRKWGEQDHDPKGWIAILGEEFGEVCKAALEGDKENYREELIQVAAVAIHAIECHDRKGLEGSTI